MTMLSKRQVMFGMTAAMIPAVARAGDVVRVPFALYRGRHPVIPVTLDGKGPYPFYFSTGAASNDIDSHLADELGLKTINRVKNFLLGNETVSAGGINKARDVECLSVTLGGQYALNRQVFTTSPSANQADEAYHARHVNDAHYPRGILGAQLFTRTPCIVDNGAQELRFYPGAAMDTAGFAEVPARIETQGNGDTNVSVQANLGGEALWCWVDMSGATELYLASKYVRKHGLYDKYSPYIEEPLDKLTPSRGTLRTIRMKNFDLGPLHFDEINVSLGDPNRDDRLDELGVKAVISRELIKQVDLAFTGDRRILVRPNASFAPVSGGYVPELAED